ncbi:MULTISPECIES: glycosyltransferase [Actinomycetes]|uniref:glycosyltransferase n=1 Tax=Actinomycetes TaxID=1760 RepID=UPI0004C24533|nr:MULTISPECIES: glycosyltransferase [Actinomycetes]
MRLVLMFYGSRGDIQPGLAFGLELQRRGHDVRMVVPPNYVRLAGDLGLIAYPVGSDTASVWDSPRGREILRTKNPYTKLRLAGAAIKEGFAAFDADAVDLLTGPDAEVTGVDGVVSGPLCQERMYSIAEKLGVPFSVLRFGPFSENGVVGAVPGVALPGPAAVNRASWRLTDALGFMVGRGAENSFRERLGLPAVQQSLHQRLTAGGVLQIQAYDPVLFPGLVEEWGNRKPIVGYLDLPADARGEAAGDAATTQAATRALDQWLAAGDAPVFVTVGSVPVLDPDALTRVITDACAAVGVRALITMKGRATGPDPSDDGVFFAESLDHAAVLPRCRAAVHHGGAGTTAAGLRAGLPTMICHGGADQAYWGRQVKTLGLGTFCRLKGLTTERLAAGLEVILDPAVSTRVAAVAGALIAPDAAATHAAQLVEDRFRASRSVSP